jgi:Family of unknown function (DUF6275)
VSTPMGKAVVLVADLHYPELEHDQIYVVWFCYILGGWKALLSTTVNDNRYYEVTYDKEKRCTYVDRYQKITNTQVPDDDPLNTMRKVMSDG